MASICLTVEIRFGLRVQADFVTLTVKWLCSFGEILYEVVQLSQCLSRLVLFLDISLSDVKEVSVKVISFGN